MEKSAGRDEMGLARNTAVAMVALRRAWAVMRGADRSDWKSFFASAAMQRGVRKTLSLQFRQAPITDPLHKSEPTARCVF